MENLQLPSGLPAQAARRLQQSPNILRGRKNSVQSNSDDLDESDTTREEMETLTTEPKKPLSMDGRTSPMPHSKDESPVNSKHATKPGHEKNWLDNKVLEKLGIEEKHDYLMKNVPLYKKLTDYVLPSIQAYTRMYSHTHEEGRNGSYLGSKSDDMNNSNSMNESDQDDNNESNDSIDLAYPYVDSNCTSSFLSMMTTANAFSGAASLKAIGNILYERCSNAEKKLRKPSRPITKIDDTISSKLDKSKTPESLKTEKLHQPKPSKQSSREETSSVTKPSIRAESSYIQNGIAKRTGEAAQITATRQSKAPHKHMLEAIRKGEIIVPAAHLRTPWENSVLEHLDLNPSKDHGIVCNKALEKEEKSSEAEDLIKYNFAKKIKETLDLDDDDKFYSMFEVWLIKDVLLQGHMIMTRDAACFHSSLPGKYSNLELSDPETVIYSGALGHKMAHYGDSYFTSVYTHQFWAVLRSKSLSIYTSATKQIFPVKVIDLKTAKSCSILKSDVTVNTPDGHADSNKMSNVPSGYQTPYLSSEVASVNEEEEMEDISQTGVWFKIECDDKTHRFHTSSLFSARHWYNSLSKVIFELQNTNSRREAIIKIPFNDMLDYRQNFVLADPTEERETSEQDEIPITFSIKFNIPTEPLDSSLKRGFKLKKPKTETPTHDYAHFIAFSRGNELRKAFDDILEENIIRNSEFKSFNRKFRQKAKRLFGDESSELSVSLYKKTGRKVTTVKPEFSSGLTIVDKVSAVNSEALDIRQNNVFHFMHDFKSADVPDRAPEQKTSLISTKLKIVKECISPTSKADGGDDKSKYDFDDRNLFVKTPHGEFVESTANLQFPRPFSVSSIKSLNILFVRSQCSFEEIVTRYCEAEGLRGEINANLLNSAEEVSDLELTAGSGDFLNHTSESSATENDQPVHVSKKNSKWKQIRNALKYVPIMSVMWSGSPEHYDLRQADPRFVVYNSSDRVKGIDHFRKHFSLGQESILVSTYYAHLKRHLSVFGKLYLGEDKLYFRSMIPGISTKMILPLKVIEGCEEQNSGLCTVGVKIKLRGVEELILEFNNPVMRDDFYKMIMTQLKTNGFGAVGNNQHQHEHMRSLMQSGSQDTGLNKSAYSRIRAARLRLLEDRISTGSGIEIPLILEDEIFSTIDVKLNKSFHITLLTIGSRGDVQPYIALGKGLVKEGHQVTIATHSEFKDWILSHGLQFKEVAGNPAELMSLMVNHGSLSVSFLKEANYKFKGWIKDLLTSSWKACQGSDLLIESPSTMAGLHIAEALSIPYMRAFTMPWTRTRAYPHAFVVPDQKRGGSYNFLTHVMFENIFWKGISTQVNNWRVETLGIPRTNLVKMQQTKIPFLYNVSPSIFPPSVDFPDWIKVTGYWFLDEGTDEYEPPKELMKFIREARENGEKIVYIGFGSIVVSDAKALTRTIIDAVLDSGVKCILNRGWSDRLSKESEENEENEKELPPQIYDSGAIPHDWLFPEIDAAVHHGGSGTTGATLRAGLPTIVKPFFGDQYFYASRVEELGVGLSLKQLNKKSLTKALQSITSNEQFSKQAKAIAVSMSQERGVLSAIEAIYSELAYSKSLISSIRHNAEKKNHYDRSGVQTPAVYEEAMDMMNDLEQEGEEYDDGSEQSDEEEDNYSVDASEEDTK